MKSKAFGRLSVSQDAIYSFIGKSSRWLTVYEISMLTGVSHGATANAIRELKKAGLVSVRKRIGGFDNGEMEFHRGTAYLLSNRCATARAKHFTDRITGVEPLAKRLRRILGREKSDLYSAFIQ